MALLTRKALIGVKFEATAGTAETLAAADADIHLSDPGNLTPDFTEHEVRPYGGTLSRNVSVIGLQSGTATFTAYGKGSGTADTAPAWGKAVIPCGMTETVNSGTSVVYAFNSTSDVAAPNGPVTVGKWIDGKLRRITGARGNVVISADIAAPLMLAFTFQGAHVAESSSALPSPTIDSTNPPVFKSGTFTVGGTGFEVSSFSLDLGNEIVLRPDPSTSTGYSYAIRADRNPRITFNTEEETSDGIQAAWAASTTAALQIVCGSAAGNTITIDAPALQYVGVAPGDRDGIAIHDLTGLCVRSAADDDELTITHT